MPVNNIVIMYLFFTVMLISYSDAIAVCAIVTNWLSAS